MALTPLRIDGVLAKTESTYATDPVPVAATNGVRLAERFWSQMRISHLMMNRREQATTGVLSPVAPAAPRGRLVELDLVVEVKGAGAAYSASVKPEMAPLLTACGMSETGAFGVGTENYVYAQADTGHSSVTLYAYAGNKLYKITGVRGSLRWSLLAGQLSVFRFAMQGMLATAPTEVSLPVVTYSAVIPPAAVGVTATVGSWSPDLYSWEFDQRAELHRALSGNAADAINSINITKVIPIVKLSAMTVPLATYDPYADKAAATARAMAFTAGSVQYNKAVMAITNSYVNEHRQVDYEDVTAWDLEYLSALPTGYTITFN